MWRTRTHHTHPSRAQSTSPHARTSHAAPTRALTRTHARDAQRYACTYRAYRTRTFKIPLHKPNHTLLQHKRSASAGKEREREGGGGGGRERDKESRVSLEKVPANRTTLLSTSLNLLKNSPYSQTLERQKEKSATSSLSTSLPAVPNAGRRSKTPPPKMRPMSSGILRKETKRKRRIRKENRNKKRTLTIKKVKIKEIKENEGLLGRLILTFFSPFFFSSFSFP